MNATDHARSRMQERDVPPLIIDALKNHGARCYDHRGGVVRYFDKRAKRKLKRAWGPTLVRRLGDYLNRYAVFDADSGMLITVGHRYRRIFHP